MNLKQLNQQIMRFIECLIVCIMKLDWDKDLHQFIDIKQQTSWKSAACLCLSIDFRLCWILLFAKQQSLCLCFSLVLSSMLKTWSRNWWICDSFVDMFWIWSESYIFNWHHYKSSLEAWWEYSDWLKCYFNKKN